MKIFNDMTHIFAIPNLNRRIIQKDFLDIPRFLIFILMPGLFS